ncbi:MAG: glycosyltransferase [Balneolaceae bacterium]|nr:glycosyltransferase [Balneolaceae bacterium]
MKKLPDKIFFSVIIPVYNRTDEVRELLQSLTRQTYSKFEIVIVEDGSTQTCEEVVESYSNQLDITYHYKENSGQGFSRNVGFQKAEGDYFIIFDSDCLIPPHYIETVNNHLQTNWLDAYGGPDKAHESFTVLQKAISYSMTSPFTTGGIRGNKKHAGKFHPRSFNMGISREVFEKTGGFKITRMGEDIEFSIRIEEHGFKTGLITGAYVYHKRRTSLRDFFNQLHFFGRARINIGRFYPAEIKIVHWLPSIFLLLMIVYLSLPFWSPHYFIPATIFAGIYFLVIAAHSTYKNRSILVGLFSITTSIVQLSAYGLGFITELLNGKRD